MFIQRLKQKNITKNFYTNSKYIYKTNQIYSFLNNTSTCYFFFYTIYSKKKEKDLQNLLELSDVSFLKIKKKLLQENFKGQNLNFLTNLLKNNILIIYSNNPSLEIKNLLIKQITELKTFYFCGLWKNKKFFRPSEIKNLALLSQLNLTITYQNLIKYPLTSLKKKFLIKPKLIQKI